jgi:hypothetical protein
MPDQTSDRSGAGPNDTEQAVSSGDGQTMMRTAGDLVKSATRFSLAVSMYTAKERLSCRGPDASPRAWRPR